MNIENTLWKLFSGALGKRIAIFIIAVLSILILMALSQTVKRLLFEPTQSKQVADLEPVTKQSTEKLTDIATWHMFGQAPLAQTNGKGVPKTKLQLTLDGIFKAEDPNDSQALIAKNRAESKVYLVGDELEPGVNVHEILAESIIINRNGVLEKLQLPKNELKFEAPSKPLNTDELSR